MDLNHPIPALCIWKNSIMDLNHPIPVLCIWEIPIMDPNIPIPAFCCRGKVAWELVGEFVHWELRGDE